jgi:hypothetical protein
MKLVTELLIKTAKLNFWSTQTIVEVTSSETTAAQRCFSSGLMTFLHKCYNQAGGGTGVSRSGGQRRGQVFRGTKRVELHSLGAGPNEASILGNGLGGKVLRIE